MHLWLGYNLAYSSISLHGEGTPLLPGAVNAPSHLTAVVSVARRAALLSGSEKEKETFKVGKAHLTHLNFRSPTGHHGSVQNS